MLCGRLNDKTVVLSTGAEPVLKKKFYFICLFVISFACINNQGLLKSMHGLVSEDKINSNYDYRYIP